MWTFHVHCKGASIADLRRTVRYIRSGIDLSFHMVWGFFIFLYHLGFYFKLKPSRHAQVCAIMGVYSQQKCSRLRSNRQLKSFFFYSNQQNAEYCSVYLYSWNFKALTCFDSLSTFSRRKVGYIEHKHVFQLIGIVRFVRYCVKKCHLMHWNEYHKCNWNVFCGEIMEYVQKWFKNLQNCLLLFGGEYYVRK